MARSFDVLILGGGNAGLGATLAPREAGLSVALVEPAELGGVCPNRGCTPKKVLVAAAHALHEIEMAPVHGIRVAKPRLDWPALIERERAMIADIPASIARSMAERGVSVLRGEAVFVGPNAVSVDGERIEARHIVIATGSRPRPLAIPGADLLITSDEVLSERIQPDSVVFIGGGVIALEFSHVYARAGTKVTILEMAPRLLPAADADAVAGLHKASEALGIAIETGVKITGIARGPGGLHVSYDKGGVMHQVAAARAVNGAGRVANVEMLDLAAGGIAHQGARIEADAHLRSTSNPAVHICGDAVATTPQLSPVATYEGRLIGRNIVEGPKHVPDYASIPACVYTLPELASVGLTEAAAREKGIDLKVTVTDMSGWLNARTYAEATAWSKILVEKASDRIVGAHILGHSGSELIHLFAFAMAHGISAGQMRETVYAFPTMASDIRNLL